MELQLSPLSAHVRTARLVGVATARRAGLSDELVDELRLAVGEACARAVALNAQFAPDAPVRIVLRDDPTGFTVTITDAGPESGPMEGDVEELFGEDHVDPRVSLAVLAGLVDDLGIEASPEGTTVTLRWPLAVRVA